MSILELGGARLIHYEVIEGERDRPHLVFLHEGLGCTEMWEEFAHMLCGESGCPGLLYDRLGCGRSSPLTDPWTVQYMHRYALIELPDVVSRLIPENDYFLVGHSDGGSIGLISASERPARLRGLVTEAAHVFVEKKTLSGIRGAVDAFEAGRLRGLAKYRGGQIESVFRMWSDTWLSDWFEYWSIEYLLPLIACPVLVLQGTEDRYGTVAQVESIVAKALDAREAMVEECGHAPRQEQTRVVKQLVNGFLEREMNGVGAG